MFRYARTPITGAVQDPAVLEARARERIQSYCAPVEGRVFDGKRYVTNVVTGMPIKQVSEDYTIVQNRDLLLPLAEKFGYRNITLVPNKTHMLAKVYTGRTFEVTPGDIVKEQIVVRNSYNKTRSFHFGIGAYRMVCSNGLISQVSGFGITQRHMGEIDVSSAVEQVLGTFNRNSFGFWKQLAQIKLDLQAELALVDKWMPFALKPLRNPEDKALNSLDNEVLNRWIKSVAVRKLNCPENLDNQRNAWGLFNGMNWAIAKCVTAKSDYNKRINGDGRAEEFLKTELNVKA